MDKATDISVLIEPAPLMAYNALLQLYVIQLIQQPVFCVHSFGALDHRTAVEHMILD